MIAAKKVKLNRAERSQMLADIGAVIDMFAAVKTQEEWEKVMPDYAYARVTGTTNDFSWRDSQASVVTTLGLLRDSVLNAKLIWDGFVQSYEFVGDVAVDLVETYVAGEVVGPAGHVAEETVKTGMHAYGISHLYHKYIETPDVRYIAEIECGFMVCEVRLAPNLR